MSTRRRAIGAELTRRGVHFRLWAPEHDRVGLVLETIGRELAMENEHNGYFSLLVEDERPGTLYRFRPGDDEKAYADPASRFQPQGPHGPSEVIDPHFEWKNPGPKAPRGGWVISEIHIGTFTPEGTFEAAMAKLPLLADAGINMIEVMPVNDFPGSFGWGYDGVDAWAPTRLYGRPDDFRRFVDAAHGEGLAVILDVVYNHFGPDGCFLTKYTPHYFTKKYENEWGDAINFDGDGSAGVREFFAENAANWIDEYRFDGLRFDATQSIHDDSTTHVLKMIAEHARAAAGGRPLFLVTENEPQESRIVREFGFTAMWNDDWHHSATVALTGKREAYYTDYAGAPQEFVSMAKLGFLYQGQRYKWQKNRRGTPSFDLPPSSLVCYLQNHDQVANSATGERDQAFTSPGRLRAMKALLLLAPQIPLLFQGEEFGASARFLYFADHKPELAKLVREGRHKFLEQFPSIATEAMQGRLAAPEDRTSFESSKIDWSERDRNVEALQFHRDLLRLRREDETFSKQRNDVLQGAVLDASAFLLRWLTGADDDRLLIVNLGSDLHLDPAPEPLLAPPVARSWSVLFSSAAAEYGGPGTPPPESDENWTIPAETALVMRPTLV